MINLIIAFITAFLVAILIGPKAISMLRTLKAQQIISEDVPKRHLGKQGTPMMGGLIILISAFVGIGVSVAIIKLYDPKITAVLALTLLSGGLGFLDDFLIARRGKSLGLKARQKLVGQFIIAIGFVAWLCVVRTHDPTSVALLNGRLLDLGRAYYPLAVLLVVGMSNAVNLTDGLDGLVGGLATVAMLTLGALAGHDVRWGLAAVASAVAGGCAGFLRYNANPAKVFMGDTGSLALGAAFAGIAMAARLELLCLFVGLIFVIEALSVIIQVVSYKTTGKRVFKMSPIHHHFELSGFEEPKIVRAFWGVQILISAIVLIWKLR